jgi:hypothetical protein
MGTLLTYLFMATVYLSEPSFNGSPQFVCIPATLCQYLSLPDSDRSWNITGPGRCSGVFGGEFDAELLARSETTAKRGGGPHVIDLYVEVNSVSARDVAATIQRIRSKWDPKKKAVIVIVIYRAT